MPACPQISSAAYKPRRPELTPCYRVVADSLATFLSDREGESRPLPPHIVDEFEAFIRCGIPAWGFLRMTCDACDQERAVAFSCKKRGWCPSCCAKRQAEAADHLVEDVLPLVPYRQMVLSFPIPLRYWMQARRKLFAKVHRQVIREMHRHYENKAKTLGMKSPKAGSVAFTQRAGSALNLNPHLHVLMVDGVFTEVGGAPLFRNLPAMTDAEVSDLTEAIARKVMRLLVREGLLDKDGEVVANPDCDDVFRDHEGLAAASSASIAGKIAFGPNAGRRVTRVGSGFGYHEEIPLAKGRLCFSVNGFSLHCNTSVNTHSRDRLRKLVEYMARGPLSNERLEIREDGTVKLKLKTPWQDGTSHLLLTPSEFLEKLSAIVPPPRAHLVKWGGVFAANSPLRRGIVLRPGVKKAGRHKLCAASGAGGDGEAAVDARGERPLKGSSWARLLSRVFKVDITRCPCGGDLRTVAAICDPDEARRYLRHVGLPADPPARAPPRSYPVLLGFDAGPAVDVVLDQVRSPSWE